MTNNLIDKQAAGGIIIKDSKALTISWTDRDYICFPKGGIETGETSQQAAVREVLEETGYRTEIISFLGSWTHDFIKDGQPCRSKVDYYLMKLADDCKPIPDREPGENFENLWLDFDQAFARLTFDDAKEALGIARAKLGH